MSDLKTSFVANEEFTSFISKFGIGKETEAILKCNSKTSTITCIKKLSSMKVSGEYKITDKKVNELSLHSDKQFVINDIAVGIIDSKKFSQILKLNSGDYWFLIKGLDEIGVEKIFIVSEKKVAEIPLSKYLNEKEKAVDTSKETIFKHIIDSNMLNIISKDCSVIDGQFFYIGFKSDTTNNYKNIFIILGEKAWHRTEIDLDIKLDNTNMEKLKNGVGNATYFKENTDGYDYILRYNKEDLKNILSAMDTTNIINVFLNLKGGFIFNESKETEDNNIDVCYGIMPIAM